MESVGIEFWVGILVILLTAWECGRSETSTLLVVDIFPWLDISKASMPLVYWVIIVMQASLGVGMMLRGLEGSKVLP